jgi:hypothetical protein
VPIHGRLKAGRKAVAQELKRKNQAITSSYGFWYCGHMPRIVRTAIDRFEITKKRFAQLRGQHSVPSRPPTRQALYAYDVLVLGKTQPETAEKYGVRQQTVAQAVRYFRELDRLTPGSKAE